MKNSSIGFLKWILKILARRTIAKYRPGIIGITGSVGKTSTKMAVAAVLGGERRVRVAKGNFNNEIGLPLTVLGEWQEIKGVLFWPKVVFTSIANLVARTEYPEILILEYAVDRPGDMKYLLEIASPNISVITAIGDIPVHVEFFSGPEAVAREKAKLIEYLPHAGFAILNQDDETVRALRERTRAHVITFGFGKDAEVALSQFKNTAEEKRPIGIAFKIEHGGSVVPVRVDGIFGKAQAYAAGAAAAVGIIFGINLAKIAESLKNYRPPQGRMELIPGIKDTLIINDSYNASPLSMHAALDTLRDLPAKRKVAVLGDMLEIGKYAIEAHEEIGRLAASAVDVLVTVGPRAKFIAEAALEKRMSSRNVLNFMNAEDARKPIQDLLKTGDLILIKGSHAMQLEKVVEEIKFM